MPTDLTLRLTSLIGLGIIIFLAWLLSERKRDASLRLIGWAVGLQFLFGVIVLRTGFGREFFEYVKVGFTVVTDASKAGAQFVFGNLTEFFLIDRVYQPGAGGLEPVDNFAVSAVFAFQVLPLIIFVTAASAVLQHLGIVQIVVRGIAWCMRRTLRTSGAETFGVSLMIFLGIESVSAIGGYLKGMTRSEIFTLMTTYLSTIAASVMVAYASFGAEPGHLLAASIMSAPAAILMAKLMVPETEKPLTANGAQIQVKVDSHNVFDAASSGASLGVQVALNVGAALIVFVGFIYLLDLITTAVTGGHTLTQILGYAFRPFAFIMGVPWADIPQVSELLATKSVFNEFLAYESMQRVIAPDVLPDGAVAADYISERGKTIATYALCGFANPGSVGIMIGAMDSMVPERRAEVAQLSGKAFIAGTLAAFATACVAGVLT
jgi:CNT family concentrative nucleoside transporter